MELPNHSISTFEEAKHFIEWHYRQLSPTYKDLVNKVLRNQDFMEMPGSRSRHHAYKGGLLIHTAQVLMSALMLLATTKSDKIPQVIVAVTWHDFGKIFDYKALGGGTYAGTEHRECIGHLPRSYAEFVAHAYKCGIPQDTIDFIGHLILSHHGRNEWGSPVEPLCAEAWCIHTADMLSSHYCKDLKVSA